MTIKLETNKAIGPTRSRRVDRTEFIGALREMKPGQSFVWDHMSSYDRNAISFAKLLLNREFVARKEGSNGSFRIHRTK